MATTETEIKLLAAHGLPSAHLVHAAMHVAQQLEQHGSPVEATRRGYSHYASGGMFPPADLRRGERLLLMAGVIREEGGMLYPGDQLASLVALPDEVAHESLLASVAAQSAPAWLTNEPLELPPGAAADLEALLPDPERREAFLLAMARRYDDELQNERGRRGEEFVCAELAVELAELGREDLAGGIRQVSKISDQLGYDVVAPKVDAGFRRIEVKTSRRVADGLASFFLSRNEAEVGRRDSGWALALVHEDEAGELQTVGWCRGKALLRFFPSDEPGGSWRSVELQVPTSIFAPGLPPAL